MHVRDDDPDLIRRQIEKERSVFLHLTAGIAMDERFGNPRVACLCSYALPWERLMHSCCDAIEAIRASGISVDLQCDSLRGSAESMEPHRRMHDSAISDLDQLDAEVKGTWGWSTLGPWSMSQGIAVSFEWSDRRSTTASSDHGANVFRPYAHRPQPSELKRLSASLTFIVHGSVVSAWYPRA